MDTEIYSYDNDRIRPIEKVEFGILGNEEIKRISAFGKDSVGVDIPDLYDNLEPKRGGLIDPRMGTTDSHLDCVKCGLNSTYCVGHFGHIDLAEPVFHMGFLPTIKTILNCVCLRCSKLLVYKNENEIEEILKTKTGKARLKEIKNLVKNVKYCQKLNYGCGAPVSKIVLEIKKSTAIINLYAESMASEGDDNTIKDKDKKARIQLTPGIVYDVLKNISDTDCKVMGLDPDSSRPENMIQKVFPVPPVQVRPSAKADFLASSTMEDDLTHKLADIIKENLRIRKNKETMNENTAKYSNDHMYLLQYHTATFFDNETLSLPKSEKKGQVTKSLGARLKGKEGRFRSNLMGIMSRRVTL